MTFTVPLHPNFNLKRHWRLYELRRKAASPGAWKHYNTLFLLNMGMVM